MMNKTTGIKKSFLYTLFLMLWLISNPSLGQQQDCLFPYHKHSLQSSILGEERAFWVSLPYQYSDTVKYDVMYIFDAEWRFDLVRNVEFDYAANSKINKHIIVGIPHIEWEYKRSYDLTFSQSRMEYDGEAVDSTWYNNSNSGGARKFYQYLTEELIPTVDSLYSTSDDNTLVGHSLGGYFAGYILSMTHPFSTLHLYDPSIWYSDGEVTAKLKSGIPKKDRTKVLITYQPEPAFHKNKIEELIEVLRKESSIDLYYQLYEEETHNSLFLPSFLKGIQLEMK